MPPIFLDTNILLRHFLDDVPGQSARASAFLSLIEEGKVNAHITDTVVFETVYTLEKTYQETRPNISNFILAFLAMPRIILPRKRRYQRVFDLWTNRRNLSFADAFHAVAAMDLGLEEIMTFDRGFDRIPGIRRIEP